MAERSVRPTQDRVELVGTSGFVYLQKKNVRNQSRQVLPIGLTSDSLSWYACSKQLNSMLSLRLARLKFESGTNAGSVCATVTRVFCFKFYFFHRMVSFVRCRYLLCHTIHWFA
jgi:hypothetical protein